MQSRKIIAVTTHNEKGGANEALTRLCRMLHRRGHHIDLWYLYKRGESTNSQLKSCFVLEKENPVLFDYIKIMYRLARILSRERPDAIVSFLPLANVLGQTLAWIARIPVRIASQRNPVQTYSKAMRALDWYFGTCGSYTDNIVNSKDVNLSVSRYPWPYRIRTKIIYNGIDPIALERNDRKKSRIDFNIQDNQIALISVGRLAKQKNHVLLIQILGMLKNFKLLIAGSGPELNVLRSEANRMGVGDRVVFLGTLNQPEMVSLLQAADIFALPSLYEGQSNALLEAMSFGLPVVASDIPSNCETLISDNLDAGIVLPIIEPGAWIETLQTLGKNTSRRDELASLAKERSKEFTLEQMCASFEATIEASLSRKRVRLYRFLQS